MRKLLVLTLAVWLGLGAAVASADVFILATVDKDKDVTIRETITITKDVDLDVAVDIVVTKAAESQALINQTNIFNEACTNCDEKRDEVINSGGGNAGVVTVNQAAGNMNNQGNAIAIAVDVAFPAPGQQVPPPPTPQQGTGFAEAQAAVEQNNGVLRLPGTITNVDGDIVLQSEPLSLQNFVPGGNTVNTVNLLFRDALISGSFNGNSGVVHVNQSPGNMNNQSNALSIAISLSAGVALAESDLGQVNVFNTVGESDASADTDPLTPRVGINKRADVLGSLNGNTGVVGVNQSVGNMANQANVVSVAAAFTR